MLRTSVDIIKKINKPSNQVILADNNTDWNKTALSPEEIKFIKQKNRDKIKPVILSQPGFYTFIIFVEEKSDHKTCEILRRDGAKLIAACNEFKLGQIAITNLAANKEVAKYIIEGALLANYQFLKYHKKKSDRQNSLKQIMVTDFSISKKELQLLSIVCEATMLARDLVNEPLSYLTAEQLSQDIEAIGKKAKFKVEVFNKAKIKSLKMGGLLAVNLGSPNPPTFNILEWQPKNAGNKKPLILVGKGVVFDTGGLSLKPTPNSMDLMKSDMSGAAAVVGAMYAIAKAKLPVHVIGLIPATENRPGGNAYVPGDVIKMHNGMTVEILNTDAEGRIILADTLSYAQKYKPELVIDAATLTGAAAMAIGPEGIVCMGNADDKTKKQLVESGHAVHERLVEFPLWEEYENYIKSDIADVKNIGGPYAGAITAGIFLKNFTDYPWLHLDIAGTAFLAKDDGYRLKNGTGVGVRLLFDFIKNNF